MSAAPRLLPPSEMARSRPWRRLVPVVVLALGAACGASSPATQEPGPTDPVESFIDGPWTIERVEPDRGEGDPGDDATRNGLVQWVVFDTAADSVEASTGCRRLLGSYTIEAEPGEGGLPGGGTATFTVPGRSTEECPAADDRAADAFRELLEQVERWSREGDRLVLEGPRGSVVLLPGD